MRPKTLMMVLTLTVLLAIPVQPAAQEPTANQQHKKERLRYRFIDLGTFGGPASYINHTNSLGAPNQINRRGVLVGAAATSIPSPPNSNFSICGGLDGTLPFVFHAFKWEEGVVTDLGTLPGADNCSVATSVNARGEIVGYSENGSVDPLTGIRQIRAVLWKDGEIRDLGTFGGNHSLVGSINNRGQVTGAALNAIPDPFSFYDQLLIPGFSNGTQTRAFLWQDESMRDLQTLGGPDAQAFVVNEHGQVLGFSYTNSTPNLTTGVPTADPFLWTEDRGMSDLGTLGGTFGLPSAFNNRGQVIGFSNLAGDQASDPFLWDQGKLIDLFTETIGGSPITANAINDSEEIVGGGAFPNRIFDAYLWRNGAATDLGFLDSDCGSEAVAINSKGQVIGTSFPCDGGTRTFLWENGSMIDLNAFVPAGSGLQLVDVTAINDRGEIVGTEVPPSCKGGPTATQGNDAACGRAYVLIPCDGEHADEQDCEEGVERTTAIRNNRASVSLNPTDPTGVGLASSELADQILARFGRNRSLVSWLRKQIH
jgi:probable HAF family extracellular repeat protein